MKRLQILVTTLVVTLPIFAQAEPLTTPRKWLEAVSRIERDRLLLVDCRRQGYCVDARARRMAALVEMHRRSDLSAINRSVNLLIKYQPDPTDEWQAPLDTLQRFAGDCEDYAILKLELLRELGWSESRMRLVFTRDDRGDHVVLAVSPATGPELILDCNRLDAIPTDVYLATTKYVSDVRLPFTLNSFNLDVRSVR